MEVIRIVVGYIVLESELSCLGVGCFQESEYGWKTTFYNIIYDIRLYYIK